MAKAKSKVHPQDEDLQARRRIRECLDENLLVEAAAGTGKTTCIVERMVNLIAAGQCGVENMVAVTFTRKAASELRERFQMRVQQRASEASESGTCTPDERSRLLVASQRCGNVFIGTIHSFCSHLLRQRPIEFNVDANFRELTADEDSSLREQAWIENIQDLIASNDPLIQKLNELDIDRSGLKRCFHQFIEFRDITKWGIEDPRPLHIDAVRNQTLAFVDEMKALLPLFPNERGTDQRMDRYEQIVLASDRAFQSDARLFRLLERFNSQPKLTQSCWHDKSVAKLQSQRWDQFRQDVVGPALRWWYEVRYEFVVQFVQRAQRVFERLKKAASGLDFTDLLLATAAGLKGQPNLRTYFQHRYTHLLVDEFQDTDPIQAEIFLYLTGRDVHQTQWPLCYPRPGSLFIVGDPKQSIYRFRRGDIVTYNRVKQIMLESGGHVLRLTRNFRSHSSLIEWNNQVFLEKFPSKATLYSPAAESMIAARQEASDGEHFGLRKLVIPAGSSYEQATFEADTIARYIRHAIDSKLTIPRSEKELLVGRPAYVTAKDFLIVSAKKKFLQYARDALQCYGIPCDVAGGNAYGEIDELQLVIDCLRAIDDPNHPIHFTAILRNRLFGFSDADLFAFRQAGGSFNYWVEPPHDLEASLRQRFRDVHGRLKRYQGWMRTLPLVSAVRLIVDDLGLLAISAARPDGNPRSGRLLSALEALRDRAHDFDHASDLIDFFESLPTLEESDSIPALTSDADVVRLMNLHKAKGLEAPIVFLADVSGRVNTPNMHIDRSGDEPIGYMAIVREVGQFSKQNVALPQRWEQMVMEESRYLDAELERLMYVATTRAGCQLIISVGKDNAWWSGLYGFLQNVPELPVPKYFPKRPEKPTSTPDAGDSVAMRWQTSLTPSYRIQSAKQSGLTGRHPRWLTAEGVQNNDRADIWGTAVHAMLEHLIRRPSSDVSRLADQVAERHGLKSVTASDLIQTIQRVMRSPLWHRANVASRRMSEVAFETCDTAITEPPTILRGVIDLLFQDGHDSPWVIVDYKTDRVSLLDVPEAVQYYRGQLETYARYWADCTGKPVGELGIYFTNIDHYTVIN